MKIKYIDYGIGFRIGDVIYLNKALKKYPELYKSVYLHEKKHSSGLTFMDFMMDLSPKKFKNLKKQYYSFLWKHPKALLAYSPLLKIENVWTIDLALSFIWLIGLLIFIGLIWII